MFGLFKSDPTKKLRKEHGQLLEQGMQAQRNGDMRLFAELTEKAESVHKQIQGLEQKS